jgi:hypothetical protein
MEAEMQSNEEEIIFWDQFYERMKKGSNEDH